MPSAVGWREAGADAYDRSKLLKSNAPLMSAMDGRRPRLVQLLATVGGTARPEYRSPGQVHVARGVGVTYLPEYELIDVVVGAAMEVLQEDPPALIVRRWSTQ
ncbi:hypothetical protein CFP59_04457 [Streptomyces malaysiensis subsp. malaysiensis]|nr:hypothetical protein CFP59_04457 [Streptomyces sp. M56]